MNQFQREYFEMAHSGHRIQGFRKHRLPPNTSHAFGSISTIDYKLKKDKDSVSNPISSIEISPHRKDVAKHCFKPISAIIQALRRDDGHKTPGGLCSEMLI